ncbi:Spectrin alpha chain, non-erythrocytic 1 [Halocaridina rubra]|uniref:Spectrin alpha chain, non-erythrocytic 1 n=1 Tax=Halocaridina rubra TaxID=373956 RepID=A0AAN8WF87_HALRR
MAMIEASGTLEDQLEIIKKRAAMVKSDRKDIKKIEELGQLLQGQLILDNKYTEHSTVSLAQEWDQTDQLGMRMQHNLEEQIQVRNRCGLSEDTLKEFAVMFRHYDKQKYGRITHSELKSCLRALGIDLPLTVEGQSDPEFDVILDVVDPNRRGSVTLQEYMTYMISRETTNVNSSKEIENAFRSIGAPDRPYVLREEVYQNLTKELAEYCISRIGPYIDPNTGVEIPGALDYLAFTRNLFPKQNH